MLNRKDRTIAIIGTILFVATLIIFFIVNKEPTEIHEVVGLIFMLISELAFTVGLIVIEHKAEDTEQIIFRAGVESVVVGYCILNFLISFFYTLIKYASVKSFMIIQILLLVITAIVTIIFTNVSKGVYNSNKKTLESVSKIEAMVGRLNLLKHNEEFGKKIERISEDLRFTDISTYTSIDDEINRNIELLELEMSKSEYNIEKIEETIDRISLEIKQRKEAVRQTKVGGI